MKNNVADSSGNGNHGALKFGTLGNISTTSMTTMGKIEQGLKFDGADDYVNIGDSFDTLSSSFSFSLWFKASLTSSGNLIGKRQSGTASESGYDLRLYPDGSLRSYFGDGTTGSDTADIGLGYNNGKWYHTVYVIDRANGKKKIFINGVLLSDVSFNISGSQNNSLPFLIGAVGTGNIYFSGTLDDVRAYNRALSAQEITQLYNTGAGSKVNTTSVTNTTTTLKNGLVGYWSFDAKDMKTSVADRSGLGNNGALKFGTLGNISTTSMTTMGKIEQGLKFDGVDDYVSVSHNANQLLTSGFTISAWIYPNTAGQTAGRILDKSHNGSSAQTGYDFFIQGNAVKLQVNNGSTPTSAANAVPYKKWSHVLVTVDSNALATFYVNGFLSGTPGSTGALSGITSTDPIYIGNRSGFTDRTFDGIIDDVRIYSRALSSQEVKQLYNTGAGSKVNATSVTNTTTTLKTGLVGYWTFDGKDMKTSVTDRSGSGNNGALKFGTLGNISTTSMTTMGKIEQGLKFDGVDDYVKSTVSSGLSGSFTASAWVKLNSFTNDKVVVASNVSSYSNYWFEIAETTGNKWVGFLYDGTHNPGVISGTNTANIGVWSHVVFVRDTSIGKILLYLNGTSAATPVTDTTTSVPTYSEFDIGFTQAHGYINGSLDDVRVYNRALSANEIKQLYNMGR